jgi:hypothetical protein
MSKQHRLSVNGEMTDRNQGSVAEAATDAVQPVGLMGVEDDGHDQITVTAAQMNRHRCDRHRARRPAHQAAACLADVVIGLTAVTVTITP